MLGWEYELAAACVGGSASSSFYSTLPFLFLSPCLILSFLSLFSSTVWSELTEAHLCLAPFSPTTSTHASLRFEQPTSSEVEGYQIISPADRPQQQPSAIPMMVPRVPSYPDVVDTAAGPQTANIETQIGQQQQSQWQPFPTVSRPPSRQDGSRPSSTFRSRASSSGVPFLGNQQGGRSGSRLSLRAISGAVVRTNAAHVAANEPSSSVVPGSSAASATDEGVLGGTETPNRFGSFGRRYKGKSSALSSSRSRKLSVRSLTEALMHKASPSSASSLAFASEEASSSAAASTSEQRPRMHARHLSWKGLTRDVGAMKNSLLSSKEPVNARSHDSSSTVASASHLQGSDTATERQDLEIGEQGGPGDIEQNTAQASQPMERRGDGAADNSRPSLLRASQSAPLSATAVNLTPAGGITLHISSVGRFPAVHRNSLSGDALGSTPVPKDLFDLMLPRELRVACMRALVRLHEEEHDTLVETGQWRGNRARQARYYGREAAMRELVRLSRVSKTWQSLLFDGQLWSEVDASLVAGMSNGTLLRIVKNSGAFVKHLSLSGRAELEANTIAALGTQQRSSPSSPSFHRPARDVVIATGRKRATRKLSLLNEKEQLSLLGLATSLSSLTTINLQGCKTLTSRALHHLLVRTPNLCQASLADVPAVTNESLVLLGVTVPKLTKLDISRCTNATASGLMNFLLAAQQRTYLEKEQEHQHESGVEHQQLRLSELHCSGLLGVDETLLATMGQALPELRSLDLSYCLGLRDSAIEAFVAHSGPVKISSFKGKSVPDGQRHHQRETPLEGSYLSLTPRQAGGNIASDDIHYRRLFPQLGHLNLSSCRHLTDRACTLLAHAMPQLEILEMANIGAGIKDAGLVRLFETTPKIRMVDLEGATDITALTMEAITPEAAYVESLGLDPEGMGDGSNATGGTGAGGVAVGGLGLRSAARRSLRRALAIEHQPDTSASATVGRRSYRQSIPPPGSQLTHLVLSHANLVDAASLLQLIRRCPKLIHLEADDTRANEAVAREFVMLARERHKRGSYISLVDCRGLTLAVNRELNSCAAIRPRQGMRGHRWAKDLAISYEDPDVDPFAANASTDDAGASQQEGTSGSAPSPSTSRHRGGNQELALQSLSTYGECEPDMVVFKSFWGWEAVDVRLKARKKLEAKRSLTSSQSRSASISAVLGLGLGIGIVTGTREAGHYDEENGGDGQQQQQQQQGQPQRWGRLSTNLLTPGDEADDARGCLIM